MIQLLAGLLGGAGGAGAGAGAAGAASGAAGGGGLLEALLDITMKGKAAGLGPKQDLGMAGLAGGKARDVTSQAMNELGALSGMVGSQERERGKFEPMPMNMHPGILKLLGG
jgi:hypothetical protein